MIMNILFGLIAISALLQPNVPRLFAVLIFASVTLLHDFFMKSFDGLAYYGGAALFDVAIIILTSGINPLQKMVMTLHKVCMVSILANAAGWVMWMLYMPPGVYDFSFLIIYTWALITFIARDGADVGGFTVDSWRSCVRFTSSSWRLGLNKHGGKI